MMTFLVVLAATVVANSNGYQFDWNQIILAAIVAIPAGISAWASARKAIGPLSKKVDGIIVQAEEHVALDQAVKAGVDRVIDQNKLQDSKIDTATLKVEGVATELNHRLDEWKVTMEEKLLVVAEAAGLKAFQRGVESERDRQLEIDRDIMDRTNQAALDRIKESKKE